MEIKEVNVSEGILFGAASQDMDDFEREVGKRGYPNLCRDVGCKWVGIDSMRSRCAVCGAEEYSVRW